MLGNDQVEQLLTLVGTLDRAALVRQFDTYRPRFPIDFTPEFLATTPLDRLQHIFVALCLQNQRMPEQVGNAA